MKPPSEIHESNIHLERYFDLITTDSEGARKEILKMRYQKDAYLLSRIALTYRDEGMFFKNGKARERFKQPKIQVAKKFIDKAFKLNPNCRDILFLKGTIYFALNQRFVAIDCYIKIIEDGLKLDKKHNCSNSDIAFVKMIVNDAYLQLYRLFKYTDKELAKKFLLEYKNGLKAGVNSIYIPLKNFL